MDAQDEIVTLTMNPVVDKSSAIDRVVPDQKLRCEAPRFEPGGGGINVARAIGRLGGVSRAVYPAGGHAGALLRELLEAEEVSQVAIPIEGFTRVNLMVREEQTGQQFRFGMPGPELAEAEWKRVLEELSDLEPFPDYLVISGSLPPGVPGGFYRELAALAEDRGSRLVVDSAGEGFRQALEVGVYLIKPNLREMRELAGDPDLGEANEIAGAARRLIESGQSRHVVVSLGRGGALVASESRCAWLHAPHVPVRSKVGAGDSMVAGIVLAMARGDAELEAARFGVAAGTAAVMTPGTELCRRSDAERLHAQVETREECA